MIVLRFVAKLLQFHLSEHHVNPLWNFLCQPTALCGTVNPLATAADHGRSVTMWAVGRPLAECPSSTPELNRTDYADFFLKSYPKVVQFLRCLLVLKTLFLDCRGKLFVRRLQKSYLHVKLRNLGFRNRQLLLQLRNAVKRQS